jgi:hypothetical protein
MSTNTSSTSITSDISNHATTVPQIAAPTPVIVSAGKAKVAVSFFNRSSDAVLIVASLHIVNAMTGNPAYPTPNPQIADIVTARNAYVAAVDAAKGNAIGVVVRKQKRAALIALLRTLSHYVQVASAGDLPTLLGSGYTAQRTRQPIGLLTAPADLRLTRGKATGEIVARCNKLAGAGAYEWRYATTTAATVWTSTGATLAARITLENLAPGTQYIVQTRSVGTTGPSNWSNAATLMAV